MKELTIEEKAKAYDRVVKEVKDFFEGKQKMYSDVTQTLEHLFPELAESEDERIRKELLAWLKSRDGQILPIDRYNAAIAWLEKQGEQKSADKVEPKFKIGDFVKHSAYSNDVYKIVSTNSDGSYELESVDGVCGKNIMAASEEYLSLWTIQDAKDGDVLCSNQIIILFKQWEDNTDYSFVIAHAGIDISGKLQITNGHWLISNKSKPATKEQRDLLFQKMKEAGYEWDAEHKQLKKIEQKPAEWSEEDDNTLLDTINILRSCGKCSTDRKLWLLSLKDRIQPQSKQEWSEEDEHYLFLCSQILRQYNTSTTIDSEVLINWIKSLNKKDIILPNKLNEEDIKTIERIVCILDGMRYYNTVDNKQEKPYQSEIDWLKSFKDRVLSRSIWKPSYVQMEVLLSEITALTEGCNKQLVLKSLYNDLKKLKS